MRALKDAPRDMLFQFTRPRGARLAEIKDAMGGFEFQFTRPRGARRHRIPQRYQVDSFNSRAREGRDDGLAA